MTMTKKKMISVAVIVLAVAIWAGFKFHSRANEEMPEVWVQTSKVEESSLPLEARAIGALVARSVEITPEVAGHVDRINFQDGSFVKQGTLLIQLNDATYRAQYDSAKAKLDLSESKFKRFSSLAKKSFVSKMTMDELEADLMQRRAEAKESEVLVNKMKLVAPFDGEVGKSKVSPGDYVNIGTSVVTLTDTKHLRIEYNIPEKFLPQVKLGQVVKVTTAAYPGKVFIGKLSFISPTINVENRSVSLYADVPNNDNLLKAGMFANVLQSLGHEERALMIPSRSLIPILEGEQVYKVVDGKAYAVTVSIGTRTEKNVQVTQGLSPGDMVITDGQLKVKNGIPVKVKT